MSSGLSIEQIEGALRRSAAVEQERKSQTDMINSWPIEVKSPSLRQAVIFALTIIPPAYQSIVLDRLEAISDGFPFGPGAEERAVTIWKDGGRFIFLNPVHMVKCDFDECVKIVLHEFGHIVAGKTNDIVADELAADKLAASWGYPRGRSANWQSIRRSKNYDKMDETIRGLRQIGREAKNSD